MKKLLLFLSLSFTAYFTLPAQDTISFTWPVNVGVKSFIICATGNKTFSVNWGDSSPDTTYTGKGDVRVWLSHTYNHVGTCTVMITGNTLDCRFIELTVYNHSIQSLNINSALTKLFCSDNQLTSLDMSNNTALEYLDCTNNQLTSLDISKNTALRDLYCSNNQLTNLDVSANTSLASLHCNNNQLTGLDISNNMALRDLYCYNNAIPLVDIYALSQIGTISSKVLGTQTLPRTTVPLNTPVAVDTVFNGVYTVFTVNKENGQAVQNTDYTITGGAFTFLTSGIYTVEITNPLIFSMPTHPAKIIATYIAGTPSNQTISFTWIAEANSNKSFDIRADHQKTFSVNWGDNSQTVTCTGNGTNLNVSPSHTYGVTGTYTVNITGDTFDCFLSYLDIYEDSVQSLDVSGATALTYLICGANQLTNLNVSANMLLTYITCNNNQLNSLDVSHNTVLSSLNCDNNAIPLADLYAASQQVNSSINARLGTQTLAAATVSLNIPIPVDTVFNGAGSTFKISKDNDTAIANTDYTVTGGMFTFLTEGVYTVEITNPAIVSNYSYTAKVIASYTVRNVGIKDIQTAGVSVYPNPATDNITIVLPDNVVRATFTLYDMQGKALIRREINNQEIAPVNNLASGIYMYHVRTAKESYQGKFLKQ
ncbi:MAG: leucine-rich repeat domain-containing protein [Bacteroidales bacterium]|jgi:Leucine-rich repeat (LRR) protein|nr:leucine-rich repeat domain-containing protein [Bacteroidales bacterium]